MSALEIGEAVDRAISILMFKTTFSLKDIKREVKSLYDRKGQGTVPKFVEHDGQRLSLEDFFRVKLKEHPGIGRCAPGGPPTGHAKRADKPSAVAEMMERVEPGLSGSQTLHWPAPSVRTDSRPK